MLASLRAELLVLRKWRTVQALLLVTPLLTLVTGYLLPYLQYRTVTPAQYDQLGTPAQILPTILPGQFVIVAAGVFGFTGTAPFVVLGAVLAGGDWGRGTIKTTLLQGPGRLRSFAGQAAALLVALAAGVLGTFLAAGAASILIARTTSAASHADASMPAVSVIVRGLAVALLVAGVYGTGGLLLGTAVRSVGAAIAVALLWTVVVQAVLDNLALQAGGVLGKINDALPNASAVSLTSTFGSLGGGADSSEYFRVSPAVSGWVLLAYIAGFLTLTGVLLRRRDVVVGSVRARHQPRRAVGAGAGSGMLARPPGVPATAGGGLRASVRAELLVLRRWPAVWAFVAIMPVYTLLNSYLVQYVFYRTAGHGVFVGLQPGQILPNILPGKFVTVSLNNFGFTMGVDGTAAFLLLGALVAGSDWGQGTVTTSLLQAPGRVRTSLGQAVAVLCAVVISVVATFLVALGASVLIALAVTHSVSTPLSSFPHLDQIGRGLGSALLVGLAYGAAGLTLGALLRSAGAAIAAALLWSVVLRSVLDTLAMQVPGALQLLNKLLPNASTSTLTHLFGSATTTPAPPGVQLGVGLAVMTLAGYLIAFVAIPAALTRLRDIR